MWVGQNTSFVLKDISRNFVMKNRSNGCKANLLHSKSCIVSLWRHYFRVCSYIVSHNFFVVKKGFSLVQLKFYVLFNRISDFRYYYVIPNAFWSFNSLNRTLPHNYMMILYKSFLNQFKRNINCIQFNRKWQLFQNQKS